MLEAIMEALPLILAALVPPAVAQLRSWFSAKVPDEYIPVLLPLAGGILASLGNLVGVSVDVTSGGPTMWSDAVMGILMGAAAVGVHQIKKQRDKSKGAV